MDDVRLLNQQLLYTLKKSGAVTTEQVERAFMRVERHRFLRQWYIASIKDGQLTWKKVQLDPASPDQQSMLAIYSDNPCVTRVEGCHPSSSTSEPSLIGRMLELLELAQGMRILEIGTGTGYNAALLAELVGEPSLVWTVEVQPNIAAEAKVVLQQAGYGGIHVLSRDGFYGAPEGAPYHRIEATVGCPDLSPYWVSQLLPEGFMLIPLEHGYHHPLVKVVHDPEQPGHVKGRIVGWSSFMTMTGMLGWANLWQTLLPDVPGNPAWKRSLPFALSCGDHGHPLRSPPHRAFYFFLGLSARELWYTDQGYGLADPGAGAAVVISCQYIYGFCRKGEEEACERLYARLIDILERWAKLGRPDLGDYEIVFIPRKDCPPPPQKQSVQTWIIDRLYFREEIHLP